MDGKIMFYQPAIARWFAPEIFAAERAQSRVLKAISA